MDTSGTQGCDGGGVMDYSGTLETDDVLVRAGIDQEAMGYLTASERREILIRAGLNPKEFDF